MPLYDLPPVRGESIMAARRKTGTRRYGKAAGKSVKRAMHKRKAGTLKSGRSGQKVKSREQAIAIGLSEAREEGAKVPRKRSAKKGGARKGGARKSSGRSSSARKAAAKKGGRKTAAKKRARSTAAKKGARKRARSREMM